MAPGQPESHTHETTSSRPVSSQSFACATAAWMFPWVWTAPSGSPVVPAV